MPDRHTGVSGRPTEVERGGFEFEQWWPLQFNHADRRCSFVCTPEEMYRSGGLSLCTCRRLQCRVGGCYPPVFFLLAFGFLGLQYSLLLRMKHLGAHLRLMLQFAVVNKGASSSATGCCTRDH